jgi:N-acetylneuraminate lyase
MASQNKNIEGILPAVVTPFDERLVFRAAAFEKLLESLYSTGIHGIYVCGQTGEGLLQTVAQRKQVAEAAVRCSPKNKLVIVHAGAADVAEATELARHAERIGATAISSLPPMGAGVEQIRQYYRAMAAATGLPFLLYYFPEICPAIADPAQLLELLDIPNVIGLKFTDFNFFQLWQLRRRGAVVFNGRDEALAAGLLMRASGGIGSFYNLVPELFVRVWELGRQERWEEAYAVQAEIDELIDITVRFPVFPAIKKMLAWSGLDCGECDPKYRPLTSQEELDLRSLVSRSTLGGRSFAGLKIE